MESQPAPEAAEPDEIAHPRTEALRLESGFYEPEHEHGRRFRWMAGSATVTVECLSDQERYLELEVLSELYDLSQELLIKAGISAHATPLVHGWQTLSTSVPAGITTVELEVNRLFPRQCYPDDSRELGIRVGEPTLHLDQGHHQAVGRSHANNVLNMKEMLEGRQQLSSAPSSLGIDLHGQCNIKPPCVYCLWDEEKKAEGDRVDASFNLDTLKEYGQLYSRTSRLISCCIGEPFMKRELGSLLDRFAADGKVLEMSTNAQVLTDAQIEHLVGRPIHLYVSVDAATAETYSRLRNRHFDRLIDNIRRLSRAKGGRGRPPYIYMVFMPMRANMDELGGFIELCTRLDVDMLVLRALDAAEHLSIRRERAGHVFDYHQQWLPLDRLLRIAGQAEELCGRAGLPFSNQLDFGEVAQEHCNALLEAGRREAAEAYPEPAQVATSEPAEARQQRPATPGTTADSSAEIHEEIPSLGQERLPLCTEPWRSFYILRRGVLPCCYGGAPLAPMEGHQAAWNGTTLRAIRAELAAGRFHDYCLRSPSCPVVGKRQLASELDADTRRWIMVRSAWHRLNRHTRGIPHRLARPALDLLVPLLMSLLGRRRGGS